MGSVLGVFYWLFLWNFKKQSLSRFLRRSFSPAIQLRPVLREACAVALSRRIFCFLTDDAVALLDGLYLVRAEATVMPLVRDLKPASTSLRTSWLRIPADSAPRMTAMRRVLPRRTVEMIL